MTVQFGRSCRLVVGLVAGQDQALDLSEMRIRFIINQALVDTPQTAEIYVYNLSPATLNKFVNKDSGVGQDIALFAGYGDNMGLIFQGQVFQFRKGRESPTDTYLCILARCGDTAHKFAVSTGNLGKGWSMSKLRDRILEDFSKFGITAGFMAPVSDVPFPRGKVFHGVTRNHLSSIAESNNQTWTYDGTTVVMVDRNKSVGTEVIVLNPETGLVGMPELTSEGLRASCLLNPLIKIGGTIQIVSDLIQTQNFAAAYGTEAQNFFKDPKHMESVKGYYNVVSVSHFGDTRGDEWHTETISVGVGALTPITGVAITAVQNGV